MSDVGCRFADLRGRVGDHDKYLSGSGKYKYTYIKVILILSIILSTYDIS